MGTLTLVLIIVAGGVVVLLLLLLAWLYCRNARRRRAKPSLTPSQRNKSSAPPKDAEGQWKQETDHVVITGPTAQPRLSEHIVYDEEWREVRKEVQVAVDAGAPSAPIMGGSKGGGGGSEARVQKGAASGAKDEDLIQVL